MSSGPDYLKILAEHRGRRSKEMGYRVIEIGGGRSLVEWTPIAGLANPVGMVHGGYVGVMVDDVCGMAVASLLDTFHPFPTAAMHIDFVRGITVDETHLCRGVVVRAGRRITVADTMIESPEGTLLARGTCTFSLDLSQSRVAGFSALG